MSYDVYLAVDAGGKELSTIDGFWANYTYNCGPMLVEATGDIGLRDLDGRPAKEVAAVLRSAVAVMDADPERFRAMDPPNGWGDSESWREFLEAIADACEAAPLAVLVVS